jgi:CheY-like chemotaxis protein
MAMSYVLVVDDDPDGRDAVARYLERSGHHVQCVPNGREALNALSETTPDVVVLDVMMPELDGITFLEVIRCYLRWSSVPVILLTALPSGPHLDRAAEYGVKHVFLKGDYRLADLAAAVDQCAGHPHATTPAG